MKAVTWILVVLVALSVGWFANDYFRAHPLQSDSSQSGQQEDNTNGSQPCAQVLTPAVNPQTGDIKEFPTPCDVPSGWEVIQNDIPGGIDDPNPQPQ